MRRLLNSLHERRQFSLRYSPLQSRHAVRHYAAARPKRSSSSQRSCAAIQTVQRPARRAHETRRSSCCYDSYRPHYAAPMITNSSCVRQDGYSCPHCTRQLYSSPSRHAHRPKRAQRWCRACYRSYKPTCLLHAHRPSKAALPMAPPTSGRSIFRPLQRRRTGIAN